MKEHILRWETALLTLGILAAAFAETSKAAGWTPF